MKNALNDQVGMLGDMFLWFVANLKQGVIYFIKQGGGNHKIKRVYIEQFFLTVGQNNFVNKIPIIQIQYFKSLAF